MERMTIHRALSELKLIGAKIEKQIEEIIPSGIMQKDKLIGGIYQKEDFEKKAKSSFQSVVDLIERRNKLKSAIVKANGATNVTIAKETMLIADAINLKAVIGLKKNLIVMLTKRHNGVKAELEKKNAQVDANALQLASVALQKQNVKVGDDDVQKVTGPFLEANKFVLVDPIGIEKKLEEMGKQIADFEAEVDAVLSEINAVTFIEI